MSDVYTNIPKSQKIFNEFWNALKDKNESLPKSCDQVIKHKLKGLENFDEYDLLTVKSVKELLNQCLMGFKN